MKRILAGSTAAVASAIVWLLACRMTGQAEAWDVGAYRQTVLPILAGLALLIGFWNRRDAMEIGIAVSLGQMVGLFLTSEAGAMWPVTVGYFVVLALPLGLVAWLGGRVRGLLGGTVAGVARVTRRRSSAETPSRSSG